MAARGAGAAAQSSSPDRSSNTAEQERVDFGDYPFGLRDLGYIEGKTIDVERRFADGRGPPARARRRVVP